MSCPPFACGQAQMNVESGGLGWWLRRLSPEHEGGSLFEAFLKGHWLFVIKESILLMHQELHASHLHVTNGKSIFCGESTGREVVCLCDKFFIKTTTELDISSSLRGISNLILVNKLLFRSLIKASKLFILNPIEHRGYRVCWCEANVFSIQ